MGRQATQDSVDLSVDATADLTALIDDLRVGNGTRVWVTGAGATHGLWCLDQTSTATVDGQTVVATQSGAGRWIYFGAGMGSAVATTVPNEAALTALGVSTFNDGAVVFCQSHRSYWTLRTQAGGLVAHEIVASSAAGRQWLREVPRQHWSWTRQSTWYVSDATGDDENTGASNVTALKTFAELRRRTIYLTQNVDVLILSSLGAGDPVQWEPIAQDASAGARLAVTITGTVTLGAAQVVNGANTTAQAGNQAALLDVGVALTPGDIVQSTDGALNGYTAVVVQLVAGTQCRTTKWVSPGGAVSAAVPANGTHVSVQTLPVVPSMQLSSPAINFTTTSLSITRIDTAISLTQVTYFACQYNGYSAIDVTASSTACSIGGNLFVFSGNRNRQAFTGCGFLATYTLSIQNEAWVNVADCVFVETGGANTAIDVAFLGFLTLFGLGVFSTGTGALLDVHDGGFCDVQGSTLYGTSATPAFGTRVRDGATMTVQGNVTPTMTTTAGGGVELDVDAQANLLPPIQAGAAVPALAACQTWAAWAAAPFNRTYVGIGTAGNNTSKATGTRVITHA